MSVLNNAANLATNITYKPFGGMSSLTYGNGLNGTIGYDNQYRNTSISAGAVQNLSYSQYDANGNITAITNALDATKNKSFTYDTLDRLASGTGSWGSLGWTYDGVGNRQTQTNGGTSTYAYQTGTTKLTGITGAGSAAFTFDLNGNTATENARQYTYNQNQRLIQVVDGAMTAGYTYNGNGQRVKKVVSGVMTIFHYDQRGQLIGESNSAGAVTAEYVYLNSAPLAKIEGSSVYFYHDDNLGTPQKLTDSTGAIVWSADYKPFGEATITVSTITNNLRFSGQYYDAETGLNYNYFRDYNPIIGRYIEADPIGIEEGVNHLYAYVGSNPIMRIDPQGLKWVWNCKRRLSWATSPLVSSLFPIFGHCYIKFGDEPLGFYSDGSANWRVYDERTPGTSTQDGGERTLIINRYCLPSWVSDCEYDCLKSKNVVGAQGATVGGSPLSNNCCTNLDAVKKECKKKCCGK